MFTGLFESAGNPVERKRLLTHSLKLWGEQGSKFQVAQTLRNLADTSRGMGLYEEGIRLEKEAPKIFERLTHVVRQADSSIILAWVLCEAKKLSAAKEAGSHAIHILSGMGEEFRVCEPHRVHCKICQRKRHDE